MALLISHYKNTDVQIGGHTLRYLGRGKSVKGDFFFRLTTGQGQITEFGIPIGNEKQILDEVGIKVVADEKMTREGVVRLRIEAPRSIRITRVKSD